VDIKIWIISNLDILKSGVLKIWVIGHIDQMVHCDILPHLPKYVFSTFYHRFQGSNIFSIHHMVLMEHVII